MSTLKQLLKEKKLSIGSWISFGFTQTCEIMARAKFDWLVIDMEHSSINTSECLKLIQIIESNNVFPIVRVGSNEPLLIKKALDAGAHGIIVPMVNTAEQAGKAIDSILYPPKGNRGVGLSRAQNYGFSFEKYKEWAEKEIVFIPQIEHYKGVNNIYEILDLEHVDAILVGPYDLSGSLGHPGNWNHPKVLDAIDKINSALNKSKKPFGFHVVHKDRLEMQNRINQGYRFIAYGVDMVFFSDLIYNESHFIKNKLNG